MTQVGSVIDGKYRVIDQIGEGGMSIVWLVTDSRLNKQWAIKEIKKNARTETHKVIVDSLRAEANLMKGLDHPALPRIVDIIEDGASLYVVMDFIQGDDLLSIMKNHQRIITEADVVDWGIQLCDALTYLHGKGIVYRDMKPGNVMLMSDGTVKIIDFGIAREYSPDKEDDTMPLGTRGYASPEAFKRGVQTTPISDIYSLGVTLFHLVTGHGPMEFVDQPTLPPIRMINPALSEGLEFVIIKATQWSPMERYQSCNEMRYDLENLGDLTREHRRKLQRTMTLFKVSAIAGVVCLALGIGTMIGSNLVRSNSYGDIMSRAAIASTEERVTDQGAAASEAEELYTQAIAIIPGDITPYSNLVNNVFKADSEFTATEGSRWTGLFNDYKGSIDGDAAYGKLCYDVGIDYFIYYSYGQELTRGSSAVSWFEAAINDYEQRSERNQPHVMTENEYSTAKVYRTIGEFSQRLSHTVAEGTESTAFNEYWDALDGAVASLSNSDAVIVRLRLCNVVMQALNAPDYVNGFSRANVTEGQMKSLLNDVRDIANGLERDAAANDSTALLRQQILDGYPTALENIESTYGNVGATWRDKVGGSQSGTTSSTSSSGRGAA